MTEQEEFEFRNRLEKENSQINPEISTVKAQPTSTNKSPWSAVGAEITPEMQAQHPILSAIAKTGQDALTIPAHFANQFLLNLPRAILNKSGYSYPESDNPVANVASKAAGIAGGIMNPLKIKNPMVAGAAYGSLYSNKDNIGLDKASLENRAIGGAVGASAGGLLAAMQKGLNSGNVINKFIGTRKKDFLFGRNPGQAVADEHLIAGSPEDLSNQINEKLKSYGQKINDTVSSSTSKINIEKALTPIDEAIDTAATTNDQNLVNRLVEAKTAITNKLAIDPTKNTIQVQYKRDLNSMTPLEATEVKRIIGEKTKFTGNPSDDKLVNSALKQSYGITRKSIEKVVPDVAPLNQRYADLKVANIAISRKDFSKTPLMGLLGGIGRGAIGGYVASHGNPIGAAIGSIAEPLLERATNNTRAKTIQAMIYKGGEVAKNRIASNHQELLGISNILNQSKNR